MIIKFDLNKFLENKATIFRLVVLLLISIIYIAPGLLMIVYFESRLLVELSEIKLFIFSAAISIPLHILSAVLIMCSPATQKEVFQDPSKLRGIVLSVGALIWAILWVFLIVLISSLNAWFYPTIGELAEKDQLIIAYLMSLSFFIAIAIIGFIRNTLPYVKQFSDNK
ncbi:hypothetical protein [Methylophaga nitratireducenticrescens]|uniref:hypothetical protein n=1 Tax=Methylophaga nitratireducenticrescens TaxID=754476 RepID=UPI00146CA54C|nr:hypothetical protein [Methylophaga nitratireducenticrescens]